MNASAMALAAALKHAYGFARITSGKNGPEVITKCPRCGRKKLTVNAASGIYKCWRGCGGGHIVSLLGCSVLRQFSTTAKKNQAVVKDTAAEYYPPGDLVSLSRTQADNPVHWYVESRGFNVDYLAKTYGVSACVRGRFFAKGLYDTTDTVIIPISRRGERLGWQSRLLYEPDKLDDETLASLGYGLDEDGEQIRPPKYFTMPGMVKSAQLGNFDVAKAASPGTNKLVVVTEGFFDSVPTGRSAVFTLGTGVSDAQVAILKANWDLIVWLLDPAAIKKAYELRDMCGSTPSIVVCLRGYKDPGLAPQDEIWRQIYATSIAAGYNLADYSFTV